VSMVVLCRATGGVESTRRRDGSCRRERRGGHPGRVMRMGTGTRVRVQGAGRRKEKEKGKENGEKGKERKSGKRKGDAGGIRGGGRERVQQLRLEAVRTERGRTGTG